MQAAFADVERSISLPVSMLCALLLLLVLLYLLGSPF